MDCGIHQQTQNTLWFVHLTMQGKSATASFMATETT